MTLPLLLNAIPALIPNNAESKEVAVALAESCCKEEDVALLLMELSLPADSTAEAAGFPWSVLWIFLGNKWIVWPSLSPVTSQILMDESLAVVSKL